MIQATYLRTSNTRRELMRAIQGPMVEPEVEQAREREEPSVYGAGRPRYMTIALVIAGHAALLASLVIFDVVKIDKPKATQLTVIEIPPDAPPPAAPEPPAQQHEVQPPQTTPFTPPLPVIAIAAPSPVEVAPPAPPAPAPAPPAAPTVAAVSGQGPTIGALPSTLSKTPIKYPVDARMRHQMGTVRLLVTIDAEGHVSDISIATSSGVASLDKAAMASVRNWRFQPRIDAGQAVGTMGYISIPFTLT